MSYVNKGSMPTTILVTREPDRSGNYVCNGTADDVDINAALIHAASLGGTWQRRVSLRGDFVFSAQVTLISDLILDLSESTITLASGVNAPAIAGAGQSDIEIIGGYLDCNSANQVGAACHGISVENCDRVDIRRVNIHDALQCGIYARPGCDHITVENCMVDTIGAVGIYGRTGTYMLISGNDVSATGQQGIYLDSDCVRAVISNNFVDTTTTLDGIKVADTRYCTIENNIIINAYRHGICLASTDTNFITIESNIVQGVQLSHGICIEDGPTHISVVGNVCYGNAQIGIGLIDIGSEIDVTSNICSLNGTHGISVQGASVDNIVVSDNTCINNDQTAGGGYGVYLYHSSGTIVSNNRCYDNQGTKTQDDGIHLDDGDQNLITGNICSGHATYGIQLDSDSDFNRVTENYTYDNTTACVRINNANCANNVFTNNSFDEGNISNAGTNTRAWLNYDPSANVFIATINAPTVVGGGGGALP